MEATPEAIIAQLEKDFFFQFYAKPEANDRIKEHIVNAVIRAKEKVENKLTTQEVFSKLAKRGATSAKVHFSGGNDEGYCDNISLLDATGNPVAELSEYRVDPADQRLITALCEPVYDRYGSFAGDFSVDGNCVWENGKATLRYSESEYVDHEQEVRSE